MKFQYISNEKHEKEYNEQKQNENDPKISLAIR